MTTDIDAVVRGDGVELGPFLRKLARRKIRPRIAGAEAFARANLVLLMRHEPTQVDLDISLAWTPFEAEALLARTRARYGVVEAPMARAEDLVIFKALAARPKDIDDAAALLILHPDIDIARVRQRLRELAAMAEEPDLADGIENVIALARATRRKPTPARAAGKQRRRR